MVCKYFLIWMEVYCIRWNLTCFSRHRMTRTVHSYIDHHRCTATICLPHDDRPRRTQTVPSSDSTDPCQPGTHLSESDHLRRPMLASLSPACQWRTHLWRPGNSWRRGLLIGVASITDLPQVYQSDLSIRSLQLTLQASIFTHTACIDCSCMAYDYIGRIKSRLKTENMAALLNILSPSRFNYFYIYNSVVQFENC